MERKISKREALVAVLLVSALIIIIALCILIGADKGTDIEVHTAESYAWFDTYSTVRDYSGESPEEFNKTFSEISELFDYYHTLFDIYNEYDGGPINLCTLNRLAGTGAVKVDKELIEFLEYSIEMYALTHGEVNIAMGAVLSVWHEYRVPGTAIPPEDVLISASEHCDINKIIIDKENSTVELADSEMSLDVGAIAKGYATEKVAQMLKERGKSGYVLDIGGNLRAVGTKADGSPWRAGVRNPDFNGESYIHRFDIADSSAVTSGNYERYYTVNGVNYHHIIDKDTLMPSVHFASVTVLCESSALADALSTALFNMTASEGKALVETLDGVSVIWVDLDGEITTSK